MANLRANNVCGTGGRNAIDGSLYFNGYIDGDYHADYLFLDDSDDLDMGTGEFTFEAWIKPVKQAGTNDPNYMGFFCSVEYGVNDSMTIQVKNDGKLRYIAGDSSDDETGTTVLWGDWHHVAIVRSGSTIKGYVNGIEEISSSYGSALDFGEGGGTIIGELARDNYPGDYPYKGYISNLRLIKGSALYTANFTPPTEKLTVVDGTVLLCCQDSNDATQEATGRTIYPHGGVLPSRDNNIIINGTFWSGTDFWYGDSGAGISASSNVATVTDGGGDYLYAIAQKNVFRIGGKYRITGTIVPTMSTSTYQFRVRAGGSAVSWYTESGLTSGSSYNFDTGEVTADGTTLEIGSGNLANNSLTQFTLQNVVVTAINAPKQTINELPPVGVDEGVTFEGDTKQNTLGSMYFPTGSTEQRGRGRAVFAGGYRTPDKDVNIIDYVQIQSSGNSIDFGDLTQERASFAGSGNETRGWFSSGYDYDSPNANFDTIDYITFANLGNATDFGNLLAVKRYVACFSNSTRGVSGGGYYPTYLNVIEYITIANAGNATDFGDLTFAATDKSGLSSPTRGVFGGGLGGNPAAVSDVIDYVTIASTGNATDFGNLTVARRASASANSSTRGVFAGGHDPSNKRDTIDYITIASTGNAADFGDLSATRGMMAKGQACTVTRGLLQGGLEPGTVNTIEYIDIETTGNALDFGDISAAGCWEAAAACDSHGGLS